MKEIYCVGSGSGLFQGIILALKKRLRVSGAQYR
jgi:hypothetical protein